MTLVLALGLSGRAHAADLVVAVGPETEVDVGRSGGWARIFPALSADGSDVPGWDFFFAAGGEYWHVPLDDAFVPDLARLRGLTGRSDLVDHGIARCPDGSWVHVGSASEVQLDDSAWSFRYDADLTLRATTPLDSAEPTTVHRDMPVVCGDGFAAVSFFNPDELAGTRLVQLDDAGAAVQTVDLPEAPIATGSSLWLDAAELTVVGFRGDGTDLLHANAYDRASFALTDRHLQAIAPHGITAYWSQGLVRVGDHFVVAHMGRDEALGWTAQEGDVWLSVFNLDWRHEQEVQVSFDTPPSGGMQPWVAWRGDHLVVAYTREERFFLFDVTIDPAVAGFDGDTGADAAPDTGDTVDTSDDTSGGQSDTSAPRGCGHGAAALLWLPVIAGASRTRRAPPDHTRGPRRGP